MNMDPEALERLAIAAKLCEIGRLGLPTDMNPLHSSLVKDQRFQMSNVFWADLLDAIPEINDIALAIRFQFENYDGTGFPDHLEGDKIPVFARILSVAREYDLLNVGEGIFEISMDDPMTSLQQGAGTRFDPDLVRALDVLCAMESTSEVTLISEHSSVES